MVDENTKVFISYSHDSEEHKERVRSLSDRLCRSDMGGIDCEIDQYHLSPEEGWPRWCSRQIELSKFVLVICTKEYLERFNGTARTGIGKGVKFEGYIIAQDIYDSDTKNTKFIPVAFSGEDAQFIPKPIKGSTVYVLNNDGEYENLYRHLTNQPAIQKPKIGAIKKLPSKEYKQLSNMGSTSDLAVTIPRVFVSKLPQTSAMLFGREVELNLLDKAWQDSQTNILCFSAMGGAGKTALIKTWLNTLVQDCYRSASRIYAWSFYSQGTRDNVQASADEFFVHALRWFGYSGAPMATEWERGEKLSELIKKEKTLLIIDGLEPLQYPPGAMQGRLKDQGLEALFRELAVQNNGTCVITTRLPITDIEDYKTAVQNVQLEHLSNGAGAQLLRAMGVKGTDEELKKASTEFKGHALALTLLGSYLSAVHNGEIRKRDLIPNLTSDEEKGGHAKRVMESYVKWLAGTPELNILFLMGLFDRPVPSGAVAALRTKPPIKNLTAEICKLKDDRWQFALKHLRDLRLLAERDERNADIFDCHPFVREYFGDRLRRKHPVAWRNAHGRLFEYFSAQAPELPNTLEEMTPLFSAISHGCAAGKHQNVLDEIYSRRIRRGREAFSVRKLGAFGSDLVCLSHFYNVPWDTPVDGLEEQSKAAVLNWTGYRLHALGRLVEATVPMKASLKMAIEMKSWKNATIASITLSQIYLIIGRVDTAVNYAKQSIEYSDMGADAGSQCGSRAALADTLHHAGQFDKVEALFSSAEEIQKGHQSQYLYLYSFRGFQYCDYLLEKGKYNDVIERARQTLEWFETKYPLLEVALDTLTLGRSHMLKAVSEGETDYSEAEKHLNVAIQGLRKAGQQQYLPMGLLARAALYRIKNEMSESRHDIDEGMNIVTRGGMKLYEADCHIEYARLSLSEGNKEKASKHYTKAKTMINEMGYHRRDNDLKAIEKLLE